MYHSKTPESVKEKTRQDLAVEGGYTRVLVCTNAAGMGVNFKVSGPFVETVCVFLCIKNIINAEMWASKHDYN